MSSVKIAIGVTVDEIKEAITDYVHRKHGHTYAGLQPCERSTTLDTVLGADNMTATVTVFKEDA